MYVRAKAEIRSKACERTTLQLHVLQVLHEPIRGQKAGVEVLLEQAWGRYVPPVRWGGWW